MRSPHAGFSLPEVLIAAAITAGIAAAICQMFYGNGRVFHDQNVMIEMQQSARMVASQVDDEVRLAGQSIPAALDDIVLPGSSAVRLNVRTGFSAAESYVDSPLPLTLEVSMPTEVSVESTAGFTAGRHGFIWNEEGWVRVTMDSVSTSLKTIRVTPSASSASPLQFTSTPSIGLDEAVAVYWDSGAKVIRRTTATNTSNPVTPSWSPANELATNVTSLTFSYFDITGAVLNPVLAEHRSLVAMIEMRITIRASLPLSNGSRPAFTAVTRTTPRNLWIRQGEEF